MAWVALNIKDDVDWMAAQAKSTIDAYEVYRDKHPSGKHWDEAGHAAFILREEKSHN